MKTIKAWDKNPGVTLLGFHDRSWLQPHYNVHSPYFIYPDEEAMQGKRGPHGYRQLELGPWETGP